jgi:hypothetical protein
VTTALLRALGIILVFGGTLTLIACAEMSRRRRLRHLLDEEQRKWEEWLATAPERRGLPPQAPDYW